MIWLVFVFFLFGCSAKAPLTLDPSMTSEQGRELALIFQGCGQPLSKGYLFCDLQNKTLPLSQVTLYFPRVECFADSCIELRIVRPSGSFDYSVNVPKGDRSISIPIEQIIGETNVIQRYHDGEYRVAAKVFFKDRDGFERSTIIEGIIRVWIRDERYQVMGCNSLYLGWNQKVGPECTIQYSTAGRSALCGAC